MKISFLSQSFHILRTRNKLKKLLKNIRNCCKLQMVFKNKTRLGNNFHFEDRIPKDLTSGVICKYRCGSCWESYFVKYVRYIKDVKYVNYVKYVKYIRMEELVKILVCYHLNKKQVKPKNSSRAAYLLSIKILLF